MRISRDKLNKLAHTVADTLAEVDEVGFLEDRNTIRQEARKALEILLTEEAKIDTAARLKIANQRKIIVEDVYKRQRDYCAAHDYAGAYD